MYELFPLIICMCWFDLGPVSKHDFNFFNDNFDNDSIAVHEMINPHAVGIFGVFPFVIHTVLLL